MDADELQVRHGVLVQVHTVVPLDRVQHIDIAQGPLERAFGVSRLIVHTAGTLHSQVTVPGLLRRTAEAMRDEIRVRIRQEAA
jgi:membrane protein YdbS with pleckstrin-like domain